MHCFYAILFVFATLNASCLCEDEPSEDAGKSFDDAAGDPVKGFGDFFKNIGGNAETGGAEGFVRGFADQAREKTESGVDAAKGFAGGIGERFSKVKGSIEETGGKMKDAITNATVNTKDEIENAGSKISKHAKEASETLFSLFG